MTRRSQIVLLMVLPVFLLIGCRSEPASVPLPDYWPTEAWRSDAPERRGFDADLPNALADHVQELPFLDGLLIIRHGYIVYEEYFNGHTAATLHDVASVTKSWTSALVGLAHAQDKLSDLDVPLPELLPEYFGAGNYADKRTITLRHLLEMRSGIAFDEDVLNRGGYGGEELLAEDLTALALSFPVAHPPGESWNYSTLDTQLISAIVQAAVGESLAAYAESTLFPELGIEEVDWWADGRGTTLGGQNLWMTPRDMSKLGLLYLHDGVWAGTRLLPEGWVAASLTPQAEPAYYPLTEQTETIDWYGYHWWVWKGEWFYGYPSFQASGYAGQQVLVFPELDLIIATTSNSVGVTPEVDVEQRTALHNLILEVIFPALVDVELKQ